jgi:hypothetical protein
MILRTPQLNRAEDHRAWILVGTLKLPVCELFALIVICTKKQCQIIHTSERDYENRLSDRQWMSMNGHVIFVNKIKIINHELIF